jgi:phosphoribosylaminoimidazole-succinocarboxamide synthase
MSSPGSTAMTMVDIPSLHKLATGKVRELYSIDEKTLLFVASDRISAYDVVMGNVRLNSPCSLTYISLENSGLSRKSFNTCSNL